jgi:Flp pilus assembly protein TadD
MVHSRALTLCFLAVVLTSAGSRADEPPLAVFDALASRWQQEHDNLSKLQLEHRHLRDRFGDLSKKFDSLQNQIAKHQREIQQAQQQKKQNDKDKKRSANDDRQLDQKIRADQQAIDRLQREQAPLSKEGKEVQQQGREVEQKIAKQMKTLWAWRHDWASAADSDLSDARSTHARRLADLEQKRLSGPLAPAWKFALAVAQAGSGDRAKALESLAELTKDDIWKAKVSSFRAYVLWQQGEPTKSESEFGRAVQLDNNDPQYYLLRSIVAVYGSELATARRLLDHAEKHGASRGSLARWRSLSLSLEPKPSAAEKEEALAQARLALQHSSDWQGHDTLAAAAAANGDFKLAIRSAEEALRHAPAEQQDACAARLAAHKEGKPPQYSSP